VLKSYKNGTSIYDEIIVDGQNVGFGARSFEVRNGARKNGKQKFPFAVAIQDPTGRYVVLYDVAKRK
jgi:hypothetical protein